VYTDRGQNHFRTTKQKILNGFPLVVSSYLSACETRDFPQTSLILALVFSHFCRFTAGKRICSTFDQSFTPISLFFFFWTKWTNVAHMIKTSLQPCFFFKHPPRLLLPFHFKVPFLPDIALSLQVLLGGPRLLAFLSYALVRRSFS